MSIPATTTRSRSCWPCARRRRAARGSPAARGTPPSTRGGPTSADTARARLRALRAPQARVLGITCVAGNHALEQVVNNTLRILDLAGAPEIPVAPGMARPLVEAQREPP